MHVLRRSAASPRPRALATVLALTLGAATLLGAPGPAHAAGPEADSASPYLVGRAVADITGEPEDSDKAGYFAPMVRTHGLHTRLRARAFVVVDRASGKRVAVAVADANHIDDAIREEVLRRLQSRLGDTYTRENLLLTSTHTHSGPGGHMHDNLYNLGSFGYKDQNFEANVTGIHEAILAAHGDLAPGRLDMGGGELEDASVNRSKAAFDRNPAADRAFFPDAIDPQTTTLSLSRDGAPVGAINWFATHGTSMTGDSTYVSGDNKGYAAYHWEREVKGVDYLSPADPSFVSAFAQTNAGDMTPNLNLRPGSGPTDDQFTNTEIIGSRQYEAAEAAVDHPAGPVDGPVDSRFTYIDMGSTTVSPTYTGDGRTHHTCSGALGTGFVAGSKEDGPGVDLINEGSDDNPVFDLLGAALYRASPALKACQAPKDIVIPSGDLQLTPNVVPLQLVRIGQLYLMAVPQEFTIVAGLRLRRTVAQIVDAPLDNVLVAGYSNGYAGYATTPEEYDKGDYEAGHTMFGRWTLPAYQQHMAALAHDMKAGRPTPVTITPPSHSATLLNAPRTPWFDAAPPRRRFGDVLQQPAATYQRGQQVEARFVGAHPNNDLLHGSTYLTVEKSTPDGWVRVADDGDWATRFQWAKTGVGTSAFTATWDIPHAAEPGTYRITYRGRSRQLLAQPESFTGTSRTFQVD
ncbi:neutral/alkaline ceramidase [Streptomyces triticagri]|uniref:neutral/alkaline ceramidase n=1 Tax=Streptomyces triticagri TaxID=2293568 RepID=UPI0018F2A65F|nr:neutral/alkaline ceramidase [Streptomyces triticagri]